MGDSELCLQWGDDGYFMQNGQSHPTDKVAKAAEGFKRMSGAQEWQMFSP